MLRVGIVGPTGTGKSAIADCLAKMIDVGKLGTHLPTVGLRILECEVPVAHADAEGPATVPVQIWDVSTDAGSEKDAKKLGGQFDACIIVVSASELSPLPVVRRFYDLYVDPVRLGAAGLVCIFSHRHEKPADGEVTLNDSALSMIPIHRTCLDTGLEAMAEVFTQLMQRAHGLKMAAESELLNDLI